MKSIKEEKGSMAVYVIVTLVSFCLILTGIYISTASARKAQIKTDIKIKEVYENSYVISESDRIADLVKNGKIKIGDYVAYTPAGDTSYTVDGTYSGIYNGTDQVINKENLNWRVLDKTEEGNVRLISATQTETFVTLNDANGYNNAVYLLDELCNTLYKGENATAKNLKIEDIQDKMDLSYWDYHTYEDYGKTISYEHEIEYPLIFAEEKDQVLDGKTGTLDLSEQNSPITGIATANRFTVKITCWRNLMNAINYIDPVYYNLYHLENSNACWLSSRCLRDGYEFCIYCEQSGSVNPFVLYNMAGERGAISGARFRPVVTLDSNVEIDTSMEGKDGKTPETAYVIK